MSFSFSSALNNLVGNTPGANVSNLVQCLNDLKTYVNGNIDQTNIAASGVGTSQLAANAVTAAKIEAQQAWQTLTLNTPAGGTWATTLPYYKDSLGMVHFKGTLNGWTYGGTNLSVGFVLGNLPAGYRPGADCYVHVWYGTTSPSLPNPLIIRTNGNIENGAVNNVTVGFWSFGSGRFRAEN